MPSRIPTPGISAPAVRKSPSATPAVTAKATTVSPKQVAKAETMFKSMKPSGNIGKDKAAVAKKTGVWPNGNTN